MTVGLSKGAWERVQRAREVVDNIVEQKKVVYGINTGFGLFSEVTINDNQLQQLQVNSQSYGLFKHSKKKP